GAAQSALEPLVSSSRPIVGISAPAGCVGSGDLRPFRGRESLRLTSRALPSHPISVPVTDHSTGTETRPPGSVVRLAIRNGHRQFPCASNGVPSTTPVPLKSNAPLGSTKVTL